MSLCKAMGTVCILYIHVADSGFFKNFLYQGGVKFTVSWVFEDLKFKISEGYNQNWCFPDCAQYGNTGCGVFKRDIQN